METEWARGHEEIIKWQDHQAKADPTKHSMKPVLEPVLCSLEGGGNPAKGQRKSEIKQLE
jgi:hypothetical protein